MSNLYSFMEVFNFVNKTPYNLVQPNSLNIIWFYDACMPIAFKTMSHGEIPVGFFNIDTDMILIHNYFVFASDFCEWIIDWTKSKKDLNDEREMYVIKNPKDIGDLMGAISGRVFTGFIGEVYKKYPFPDKPEGFRQKPEGFKTRKNIEKVIDGFAVSESIKITTSKKGKTIAIGDYVFSREHFHEVISYIWRGGMPKWKDNERPEYVKEMMKAVITSQHWLFKSKAMEI